MKKLFWLGCIALLLFEVAAIYFIMPMPGSQRMNSIDTAYFLYRWRWGFRCLFGVMIIIGLVRGSWRRKWALAVPIIILAAVIYMANYKMAADAMFKQPQNILFAGTAENKVDRDRLVIGVTINGESKAYPIRFLGYHHHVQDVVGGKPILVTYCTVCRTGRVYEPVMNGKKETFRLVGMDHFNAMLEDAGSKSWWQQATGKAVAGKLKGQQLPEVLSTQTSMAKWLELHPDSKIMQADPVFITSYDSTLKYESGASKSKLTGTDSLSWKDKSWVIGIKTATGQKAYDWNLLKKERIIHDNVDGTFLAVVLASDNRSFFAFGLPSANAHLLLKNDTLLLNNKHFRIDGTGIDTSYSLQPLQAYQEFWHSWRTFNPQTGRYLSH
ncbi:hypothetical protein A4D02_16305 [Niastella koreensis]|uniref:DUF3179 domain-containing protein n=2 Tax=Niastella koreensis TaxID=354356 RepID=G8TN22_NIAKG|nr:DUF3179 domain-containing (seleno)protein [Niastella koreensis]AEV97707.1 hypothetical protein Niako_1336 [Niastella koreensis GR20-10]OQP40473.1 hypothetical protein A4D02_16305 [Niastella koreensis]